MCKLGNIAPDIWMKQAVDGSISSQPLIEATEKAIAALPSFEKNLCKKILNPWLNFRGFAFSYRTRPRKIFCFK
jgi:hypothetical protein